MVIETRSFADRVARIRNLHWLSLHPIIYRLLSDAIVLKDSPSSVIKALIAVRAALIDGNRSLSWTMATATATAIATATARLAMAMAMALVQLWGVVGQEYEG